MGPTRGLASQLVGNGFDDVASETTTTVGQSAGTFPAISGLTSETGGQGCYGGSFTSNCYSLQLNSNVFIGTSSYFTGSTIAWEQFVYSNSFQQLFIQYWLINYIGGTRTSCPTTPPPGGTGWFLASPDCYANSPVLIVPGGKISATNLGKVTLSGFANSVGSPGNNIVQLCISGGSCYSVSLTDGIVNLYQHWAQSEFNVFGDGGGSEANFNLGTSIQVSTALMTESGSAIASSCANNGTTGETNNLYLQGCEGNPSVSSGVSFVECVGASGQSTCPNPLIEPSLGTSLSSSSIGAGGSVTDKATLSGGIAPTGNIGFFYSTSNACPTTGATQMGTSVTVSDNGAYTSASQTFPTAGTYYVYALYSGDGVNKEVASACEPLVVGSVAPALGTVLSANAIVAGGSASDSATLSGGSNPTGSITFFDSTKNTCPASGATQVGTPVTVTGDGSYPSTSATFSTPGTYYWYATYSGDSNNNGVTSQCEPLSVTSPDMTSTSVTPDSRFGDHRNFRHTHGDGDR